jgi:RNA polymerase sigma factor (sigma-70 family)
LSLDELKAHPDCWSSAFQSTLKVAYRRTMYDREIVAAIVEGDSAALAAAFDQYAQGLYDYCRSLLAEPPEAAEAVQDTFIVAPARLSELRNPERLRAWLFAVARNECHSRLRVGLSPPSARPPETMESLKKFAAKHTETRDLVRAALVGLKPAEREALDLNLRHEFAGADLADILGEPHNQAETEGADLADILGVPPGEAQRLASRASSRFKALLGVLLVARSGDEYCPELASMLDGSHGPLSPRLTNRVNRHIERCTVCGERMRRELRSATMLSRLPLAILPTGLRARTVQLAADVSPGALTYRARVVHNARLMGPAGFPVQLATPSVPRWQGSYVLAAVAAVAALVLLGGGMFFVDYSSNHASGPVAGAHTTTAGPKGSGAAKGSLALAPSLKGSTPAPSPAPAVTVTVKTGSSAKTTTPPVKTTTPPVKTTTPPVKTTTPPVKKTTPPPTSPPPTSPPPTSTSPTPSPSPA